MPLLTKILIGWGAFVLITYLVMWYDSKEHHVLDTFRNIKDSFTQDE